MSRRLLEYRIQEIRADLKENDWLNSKVELRQTSSCGAGLYAKATIDKGELVLVWGCAYANREEAEKAAQAGLFVMQWDEDLFTIDDGRKTIGYFVNHSCDPNLGMAGPYALVAMRNIQVDEELCPDYAMWEADETYISAWDCCCGSINCRRKITGLDWRSPELQERYRGHFSPFIMKKKLNN
jgi:uncharacterized protein